MMPLDLKVFKEPKGVLRILQILFILITIISICSVGGEITFTKRSSPYKSIVKISYPFGIVYFDSYPIPLGGLTEVTAHFSVSVACVSLIYCVTALLIYTTFGHTHYRNPNIRKADFLIGAFLSPLWFVIGVTLSVALSKCHEMLSDPSNCGSSTQELCDIDYSKMRYKGVYIGIGSSFMAFGLFISVLWFLWKGTLWSKGVQKTGLSHHNQQVPAETV